MFGLSNKVATWFKIILAASLLLPLLSINKAEAADFTIATSAPSQNKTRYLSLASYPQTVSNWPFRNQDGCSGSSSQYKAMPWLGDTDNLSSAGDPNFNSSNTPQITGDTLTDANNCATRYDDGGTNSTDTGSSGCSGNPFRGAWICPNAYGGWTANGSTAASWSTACDVAGQPFDPVVYMSSRSPRIWGTCSPDTSDASLPLFRRNNPSYNPRTLSDGRPIGLYGVGSTLFRNEFTLTGQQIADLTTAALDPFLQITADDWFAVYINGIPFSATTYTAGYNELAIPRAVFRPGQNVIAIQVINKAYWNYTWSATGDGAALWYTLLFRGNPAPPPPPAVSCTLDVSPASVMSGSTATLTWSTTNNPTTRTINNGVGTVGMSGSMPITVTAATTYQMTVARSGYSGSTCSDSVTTFGSPIGPGTPKRLGPWDGVTNLPPVL